MLNFAAASSKLFAITNSISLLSVSSQQCYHKSCNSGNSYRYYNYSRKRKQDYYKVLGISKDANESEIKAKYRELAKSCHPDAVTSDNEKNKEKTKIKFQELQEAYDTLIDKNKRRQYDENMNYQNYSGNQNFYYNTRNMNNVGDFVFTQSSSINGLHLFMQQAVMMKALQEEMLKQQILQEIEKENIKRAQEKELKKYKKRKYRDQMDKVNVLRNKIKESINKTRGTS